MLHPLIEVGTATGLLASLLRGRARASELLLPAEALGTGCGKANRKKVNHCPTPHTGPGLTGRTVLLALVYSVLVGRGKRCL